MKQAIESLKSLNTRKALRVALRNAAKGVCVRRVVPAPALTPNQVDALMHRRLDSEHVRRNQIERVFGKKKRLPMPIFSCENPEQVRPRVVGEGA